MGTNDKGEAPAKDTSPPIERNEFRRFISMNQVLFTAIAKGDIHLTNTELRTWSALCMHAEVGNYVYHTQAHMARVTGIHRPNFNAALQALLDKDFAVILPDIGKGKSIMLSPFFHWKGSAKSHRAAMAMYNRHVKVAQQAKLSKSA